MTVLNWSIFFRQRFRVKICFAIFIYLQHAIFTPQNNLKRKSKVTGSQGSKSEGFQLSFKNSSIPDHFLIFFEPSCTPSKISCQATVIFCCSSSFLWLLPLEMHYLVLQKFQEEAVQIISNFWFSDCLLFESPCRLLNCLGKVFTTTICHHLSSCIC